MKTRLQTLACCCFLLLLNIQRSAANDPVYEQRKSDYIQQSLNTIDDNSIVLQAHQGLLLNTQTLNTMLGRIATRTTSDFDIVKLIRIVFFTNGAYDSLILPVLYSVPYWLTKSDTVRNYWSENHMIMWMSSDWLLHERYGKTIDGNLRARLTHYLELKIQYGYYEFFSSVYAPFSLTGLLNLADFAQDAQIKSLATQAVQRLLGELLLLTNDKGVFFPVAGRNYPGKYNTPYDQNHNNLIYLLTGFGQPPVYASHAGVFLSTSPLETDSVVATWMPALDTVYSIGHSLEEGFALNSGMSPVDKVIFQWSSGAYFHPDVVFETASLLADSNLWNHVDFELLRPLSAFSPQSFPSLSASLSMVSKSSVICGQDIAIFKHYSVTLSSALNFWKGKVGFQQHPCVANVGTTAVYLASGEARPDWENRNSNNANYHLPYIMQQKNLALLMYRPEPVSVLLGNRFAKNEVALFWRENDFDETADEGLWLLGRQGDSYVAVRRNCIGEINGVKACPTQGGQAWALLVGDSAMYGSFGNFKTMIRQAQFSESWQVDSVNSKSVYYAKVSVDTLMIEYAWETDTLLNTGLTTIATTNDIRVYPNPVTDLVTLDVSSFKEQTGTVTVSNMLGQRIYESRADFHENDYVIQTASWQPGIYFLMVENGAQRALAKLLKQ